MYQTQKVVEFQVIRSGDCFSNFGNVINIKTDAKNVHDFQLAIVSILVSLTAVDIFNLNMATANDQHCFWYFKKTFIFRALSFFILWIFLNCFLVEKEPNCFLLIIENFLIVKNLSKVFFTNFMRLWW